MNINTTEYSVNINEAIFNQAVEQSVDIDFTLPDYCPNIQRVLKCITTPVVVSKSLNGTQANIDGMVEFCFIYIDEDNTINSYCYSYPFNKLIDIESPATNPLFTTKIKVDYMNVRAVSERRVEIHGAIGLLAQIFEKTAKNIISDIDADCVFKKNGTTNAITPITSADKNIIIEEDIEIGQGKPAVKNIVKKTARVKVEECKIISNKAVIKGDIYLKLLYCPEPIGRLQCFETKMPFSQVMELNGVTDECKCDINAELLSLDIDVKSDLADENRTLSTVAKVMLSVSAYCDNDIPVIFDVFSNKYDIAVEREEVAFERVVNRVNENYLCKKVLEFSDNAIGTVIDLWGDTYIGSVKCLEEKVLVKGTVNISILGYDTNNVPVFFDRGIEFEYSFKLENQTNTFKCNPNIKVSNISFNLLDSNKIEIRAELNVDAVIFDIEKNTLITKVEINEEASKQTNRESALVLYYADSGEEIWDIAKKYNADPNEICELNELDENIIKVNKALLIP